MQGTPFIYQGEEIGMTNVSFDSINDYQDIESRNAFNDLVGNHIFSEKEMMRYIHRASRDNARTPMQWDDTINAGFSTGIPWIRVNPNYKKINVKKELESRDSILSYYKHLLDFRHNDPIIRNGDFTMLCPEDDKLFIYARTLAERTLYVICNFTAEIIPFSLGSIREDTSKVVLCNYLEPTNGILSPYEARVLLSSC